MLRLCKQLALQSQDFHDPAAQQNNSTNAQALKQELRRHSTCLTAPQRNEL
jgi:hypothetical protein